MNTGAKPHADIMAHGQWNTYFKGGRGVFEILFIGLVQP